MTKTALILGASGGVGGETARALIARGWQVHGLVRKYRAGLPTGIGWFEGDAMNAQDVLRAAKGASTIVHAVNPPGYRDWSELVLPMLENSIAAARAENARLALPGTIYNYDPAATPVAHPDSLQEPTSRKGLIRREMEDRIAASGVRALILRAGDFYGPRPGNSWLSQGMITPGKPVGRRALYPGKPGAGHSWAYLPDVGETFARLLDREGELERFARFHFAGCWDRDGSEFLAAIGEAVGHAVRPRAMPWRLLPIVAPFNTTMREMIEMQPYWMHAVRLDNRSLVEFLGEEPRTPLVSSLRTTLQAMGCLPKAGMNSLAQTHAERTRLQRV